MRAIPFVFAALVLTSCPGPAPVPPLPGPQPDSSYCAQMCDHIGPNGLKCQEGNPIYDSDLPGPAGVPNESCTDFCTKQQGNGVFINPKCVAQVAACADIESARKKTCN